MITRDYGKITFVCDECDDAYETDEEGFDKALYEMKNAGWSSVKDEDGNWKHFCPDCL